MPEPELFQSHRLDIECKVKYTLGATHFISSILTLTLGLLLRYTTCGTDNSGDLSQRWLKHDAVILLSTG